MTSKMNQTNRLILQKIKILKSFPFGKVKISCNFQTVKYQLLLVTSDCVEKIEIINLLAKWRKKHEKWFLAQFPVTFEGTKLWLKKRVIETPDRLLFMIKVGEKYIGHAGFFRFDFKTLTCEIDNVIRGASSIPGIMTSTLTYLIQWGRLELGLRGFMLQTTSDNSRALKLYERMRFYEIKRVPLVYIKKRSTSEWVEARKKVNKKIQRYNIFMGYKEKKISFAGPWISQKEVDYATDAVKNGFYETYDMHTKKLEKIVADYLGVKYALATHCCTLALHLACATLGLKKGDEVICTDFSWIATAYSIVYTGATPVFVDIDPDSWCIAPSTIEAAITKKTKAIMLVHSFGYPAQMDKIMKIAKKHKLKVIEDAAPSLGAEFKGRKTGTFGDIGCFSFQGAKIAAAGEGGILVTNDKDIYKKALLLASMGRTDSKAIFWSDMLGFQYTIANLTAALALAQVERIDELIDKKRIIFNWYYQRLKNFIGIKIIKEKKGVKCNYCYPSILLGKTINVSRRDVLARLKKLNIHARPTFPRMSKFPLFQGEFKSSLQFSNPVAEFVSKQGISLPAAANLDEADVDFVCRALKKILYE